MAAATRGQTVQWAARGRVGQTGLSPTTRHACPLGYQAREEHWGSLHPLSCSDKTTQKAEDPRGFPTQAGAPCSALGSGSSDSVTFQAGKRCGRREFDPWVGKTPWRRQWQHAPVFFLGHSMDRGAWQATVHGSQRAGQGTSDSACVQAGSTHTGSQPCLSEIPKDRGDRGLTRLVPLGVH